MSEIMIVFVGGGVGAAARYWLSGIVYRFVPAPLPSGTFVVNVLGCFAIGVLMSLSEQRFIISPAPRLFLSIGILGGFTTFSTFSYETITMLREGALLLGGLNVVMSIFTCLLATYIGMVIGKIL